VDLSSERTLDEGIRSWHFGATQVRANKEVVIGRDISLLFTSREREVLRHPVRSQSSDDIAR
jgi:hypothetical protein